MKDNNKTQQRYSAVKKLDVRTLTMVTVLVVLWMFFTYFTSDGLRTINTSFLSARNLSNLMRQMTTVGLMGISMVLVMVSGGIDLSAGAVAGFIGCTAAYLQVLKGVGTPETILICLTSAVMIFVVQGSLISHLDLPPFIVTLGGMLVFKGLILFITNGSTIAPLKESLVYMGQGYINKLMGLGLGILLSVLLLLRELWKRAGKNKNGTLTEGLRAVFLRWISLSAAVIIAILIMNYYRGMPVPVLIMFVLAILLTLVAERTTFGRSIYAIGGNLDAARYSGINVKKNLVIVYSIHGLMVGFAGLVLTARLNSSSTAVANMSLELDAIAAAVISGTSMSGGIGKVSGAILGALIMGTIDNGMSMMNLAAFWQYIVKGIILVAAVWFDTRTNKTKKS